MNFPFPNIVLTYVFIDELLVVKYDHLTKL